MNWSAPRIAAIRSVQAVSATAAAIYAGLAIAYTMPMSPAKLELQRILEEQFSPIFFQNWSLFAPDPINQDDTLLIHCSSDPALARTTDVKDEEWDDVLSPLWDLARSHRLSPWERLSRPLAYPVRAFQGNASELVPWATACVTGEASACTTFENGARAIRDRASKRLVSIGTAYCRSAHAEVALSRVAIRVRQIRPPSWSKRWSGTAMMKDTDVGVFPPSQDALPIAFFLGTKE